MPAGDAEPRDLRVAIIGAGPAGFYAADALLKSDRVKASVDLFDALPTPYGLVRAGVAPDHAKIKSVTRKYDATAGLDGFRFFGNVALGKDITVADLRQHYHQILYTVGAQVDRRLGIPGEDLNRSHSATEFVAWYNGHPDYRDLTFDLSQSSVVVVGVGNVAVDVARILCRTKDELAQTDIADYALEQLAESGVRDVYMLGRRGPAQAAFTNPEAKELGELADADIIVSHRDAGIDAATNEWLVDNSDRLVLKKIEMIKAFAEMERTNKRKRLHLQFLVSPTEIIGRDGAVVGIKTVRNELKLEKGRIRPHATDEEELIDCGLVFRSVGYRGAPIGEIPFDDWKGVIRNEDGRVTNDDGIVRGEYVAGWIKRGPTGVIGTNKSCAQDTVALMIEDASSEATLHPTRSAPEDIDAFIDTRGTDAFSWDDWLQLDKLETDRGAALGRPRLKFTTREEMIQAILR